jgi:hypothetical protein
MRNAKRRQHKVNVAKGAVLFHYHFCRNSTAYFRLQLFHQAPYFGIFWPNVVFDKSSKIYLRKSCSAYGNKNVGEIRMAFVRMAFGRMAFGRISFVIMAFVIMAFVIMAFVIMAFVIMAFVIMAFVMMAFGRMAFGRMAFVRMAFVRMTDNRTVS